MSVKYPVIKNILSCILRKAIVLSRTTNLIGEENHRDPWIPVRHDEDYSKLSSPVRHDEIHSDLWSPMRRDGMFLCSHRE